MDPDLWYSLMPAPDYTCEHCGAHDGMHSSSCPDGDNPTVYIFTKSGSRVVIIKEMGNFATVRREDTGKMMYCPMSSLVPESVLEQEDA